MKEITTGERIRELRIRKRMTQKGLGSLAGVSGSAIGDYENNTREPKKVVLEGIAEALKVSPLYLAGMTDDETGIEAAEIERKDEVFNQFWESIQKISDKLNPIPYDVMKEIVIPNQDEDMMILKDNRGRLSFKGVVLDSQEIGSLYEFISNEYDVSNF